MKHNLPYLKDPSFLKQIDRLKIKEQYVKITVLTFDEKPIHEIEGLVIGGSISLDGSSGMRRTCNLNLIVNNNELNPKKKIEHILSLNKKIDVLIGFVNTTNKYNDYPILWFPQGIYLIIAANFTHSLEGVSIALTLHDKMALLNGECGGTLPASVTFSQVEDINQYGETYIRQPTIYQIIQELINHFGNQQLGKIIISDIDNKIKQVMKWTGSFPLYLFSITNIKTQDNIVQYIYTTNYSDPTIENAREKEDQLSVKLLNTFSYGEDIGYIYTDFTYPGELVGNAGDTIVTILDQIKNILGNYEYFYDIQGNFRFQQIKNYLNNSYSTEVMKKININEINNIDYVADFIDGKSVYTFNTADIIQSYSNSPNYQQIKNDFLVWGVRKTVTGQEIPIRYHLAIDQKPSLVEHIYQNIYFFEDPYDGIVKAKVPLIYDKYEEKPLYGEQGQFYYFKKENKLYHWDITTQSYIEIQNAKLNSIRINNNSDYRSDLYFSGVINQPLGTESNYYYTELKNEWPKLCEWRAKENNEKEYEEFYKDINPSDIDYFLDIINTPALEEFNVQNIGRRTTTIVDDSINCIFQPNPPNIIIIEKNSEKQSELKTQCENSKQDYSQVESSIYNLLAGGGYLKSAYEEIRKELYQYTNYGEQVNLTTLPIFYLEPNTRITIQDNDSLIFGDFIIKSISLPLDINGTMNISCIKALERI